MLLTKLSLSMENHSPANELQDMDLDLEPIARQLADRDRGLGWTQKQTARAIEFYKMFLYLIRLYPHTRLVPTWEIDQVWHRHILTNTYQYVLDCQKLFGRTLHHVSHFGQRNEPRLEQLEAAFVNTQALFRKHFGVVLTQNQSGDAAFCFILNEVEAQQVNYACEILLSQD